MKAINDRLFMVHADHAAPAATHDAVARVAALLLECCTERPTYSDLIVDAVMDTLAKVRPGWARTDAGDIPSTGCPTCDAVIDTLAECHGMSLRGTTAAEVAESALDWIGDLIRERNGMRDDINRAQVLLGETFGVYGHTLAAAAVAQACEAYVASGKVRDKLLGQRNAAQSERDEARAEVERLRAEVASLRPRPTRDELADYARRMRADADTDADADADADADEPDDGWEPGPWWTKDDDGDDVVYRDDGHSAALVVKGMRSNLYSAATWYPGRVHGEQTFHPTRLAAMRWCEQQPELADVISTYISAPTVGAPDAGPDAPALIVEGDDGTGAREARAVPAAPVSGAEQSCGETGADRPHGDERIVGPREGEEWPFYGSWPYGYQVDDSGDERLLLTDQHEAMVMRLICQWHGAGVKVGEIAARLNRMELANRKGVRWYPASVRTRIRTSYDEWREVFG